MAKQADKYRSLNVQLVPGHKGTPIAYFPQLQQSAMLSPEVLGILQRFQTFSALDAAPATAQLAASGLLVRAERLWTEQAEPEPAATIETFGILTCGRPDMLRAALASYATNFHAHGRTPDILVCDDARGHDEQAACRALVASCAAELDLPLHYAGAAHKHRLAEALADEARVDLDVVRYALFGDGAEGRETIGGNRNALSLLSAGGMLLSADDDTRCDLYTAPNAGTGAAIAAEQDPTELWFFPSREVALASGHPESHDLLAAHEHLLGRPLHDIARVHESRGDLELGAVCDHVFEHWVTGAARVRVTFAGVLGDSGMYSGAGLRTLRGGSRERLFADYEIATTSREVLRVARTNAIVHGPPFMSTTAGFDHRALAVPFLPFGRNEDGVFGVTTRLLSPSTMFGHVPLAVLHAAAPHRKYADAATAMARPRLADLMISLMITARPVGATDADRMRALGRFLADTAAQSEPAFLDDVCRARLVTLGHRIEQLERELARDRDAPVAWRRDLEAQLAAIQGAISNPAPWRPHDLVDAEIASVRRAIGTFGHVLEAWPALFAAATRLRGDGRRFADTTR